MVLLRRVYFLLLMTVLLLPALPARADQMGPGEVAESYLLALSRGDYGGAASLCTGEHPVDEWKLSALMKNFVYPGIEKAEAVEVTESGDTAQVKMQVTALDFRMLDRLRLDGVPYDLRPIAMWAEVYEYDLEDDPEYAAKEKEEAFQLARESCRTETEATYLLTRVDGAWKVDISATGFMWMEEAGSVTPSMRLGSYGMITHDYAADRYYREDDGIDIGALIEEKQAKGLIPRELPEYGLESAYGTALQGIPPANDLALWLRIEAPFESPRLLLESLNSFRMKGAGDVPVCSEELTYYLHTTGTSEWEPRYFMPKEDTQEAILEASLPRKNMTQGEITAMLQTTELWCDAVYFDGSFRCFMQPAKVDTSGVVYDSLYREGSLQLTATEYERVLPDKESDTVRGLIFKEDQYWLTVDEETFAQHMSGYALYRLDLLMEKEEGPGVYDVMFRLKQPVEDAWVQSFAQCSLCYEIDDFDLWPGEDARDEDLYMLVRTGDRTSDEIEALLRSLKIEAVFSSEKLKLPDIGDHNTTSYIGPRSSAPVDMSALQQRPADATPTTEPEYVDDWEEPKPTPLTVKEQALVDFMTAWHKLDYEAMARLTDTQVADIQAQKLFGKPLLFYIYDNVSEDGADVFFEVEADGLVQTYQAHARMQKQGDTGRIAPDSLLDVKPVQNEDAYSALAREMLFYSDRYLDLYDGW